MRSRCGTAFYARRPRVAPAKLPPAMDFFSIDNLLTLLMLTLLQAVLGFDNLLYISIESKRVGEEKAPMVRQWGIGLAVAFRIILLFIIVALFDALAEPLFGFHLTGFFEGEFTFQSLITLAGGLTLSGV